jgi:hypothetical protein
LKIKGNLVTDNEMTKRHKRMTGQHSGGDMVYILGWLGAIVYYFQQADTFSQYILGLLKAIVWPAIMVYQLLKSFM